MLKINYSFKLFFIISISLTCIICNFAFSQNTVNRHLPNIKAKNSNNKNEILYSIPLQFYNPKLGNYSDSCQFDLNLNGKLFNKYKLSAPYEFDVAINSDMVDDSLLQWDNKVTIGSTFITALVSKLPICISSGDIYVSEIYAAGWRELESQFNNIRQDSASCLQYGMDHKKLPYSTERQSFVVKYPSVYHPVAREVISECEKIAKQELKKNYDCSITSTGRKTKCDEDWYETNNGQSRKINDLKYLIQSKLSGKNISVIGFETTQEFANYKELVSRREAENAKRIEAEETRKNWLASPEGKKYLAEEAVRSKKAEELVKKENSLNMINGSFICLQENMVDKRTKIENKGSGSGRFKIDLKGDNGVMSIPGATYGSGPWFFNYLETNKAKGRVNSYRIEDKFFKTLFLNIENNEVNFMVQETDNFLMSGKCTKI